MDHLAIGSYTSSGSVKALVGGCVLLNEIHVQITLLFLDLHILPNTFCTAFVLRLVKRENVAVFLDWVLQLKPLMVVTEEAIPGPVTERDESAETSDQSISCVVSSEPKPAAFLVYTTILQNACHPPGQIRFSPHFL